MALRSSAGLACRRTKARVSLWRIGPRPVRSHCAERSNLAHSACDELDAGGCALHVSADGFGVLPGGVAEGAVGHSSDDRLHSFMEGREFHGQSFAAGRDSRKRGAWRM